MKFLTRKLVTPADLNPRGTLHGGQLLKWIDEEGGIHACLELDTGLIVTKLDGSAKGGILLSLAEKFSLPVHAIGVGEKIEDLQSFEAQEFAKSLMGLDK